MQCIWIVWRWGLVDIDMGMVDTAHPMVHGLEQVCGMGYPVVCVWVEVLVPVHPECSVL